MPIFIDVSVNNSDFAKCSAARQLLNHCTWLRLRAKRCFLRFVHNLRTHCFGEGNWVEHFSNFWRFCSTFEAVRAEFGVDGRQKSDISPSFCLLSVQRAPFLEAVVDKKESFLPVFVYCPSRFKVDYGQIVDYWNLPVKHSLGYGQKAAFWDLPVKSCRTPKILQNHETSRRQFLHRHWIYKKVPKLGMHVQMKHRSQPRKQNKIKNVLPRHQNQNIILCNVIKTGL